MLAAFAGGHLNLPFAGLAVGDDEVGPALLNLTEQRGADSLGYRVILSFKPVGACDAAALGIQHLQLQAGDQPQQLEGIQRPAHLFHMTRGVIDHFQRQRAQR